uniref:Radical S-adenosyl methionine domain-containing protein n=1 Tax=Falco tinnunculus TaxID=100819 RepID=A0A8C4U3Z7_FALTI
MAARGWRPLAAAIAAARPGGGGPGAAPAPAPAPAAPTAAALYVHWPYCRKRCSYCNFNKYVVPAVDEVAVRACLVREARTLLRLSQVQSVTSVFFGGGTPSLASPSTIAAVLEAVAGAAHLPAGAEVTLEANPSSTSIQRLAGFRAAGVNRLSVGVQSLDDAELQLLGREHTAAEARGAVEAAWGLFPGRTSLDLLFGLPGQSRDAWAQGLEAALGLCDDHISLYQLTLEQGTALAAQVWGGALPMPPQDLLADMYLTARAMLVAAGFRHYEVSNFARKGALSTHNLSYWRAEQYIGVGPGWRRCSPWDCAQTRASRTSAGGSSPPTSACRPRSGRRGRRGRCRSRAGWSWMAAACGARGRAWPCWTRCCPTCSASCSTAGPREPRPAAAAGPRGGARRGTAPRGPAGSRRLSAAAVENKGFAVLTAIWENGCRSLWNPDGLLSGLCFVNVVQLCRGAVCLHLQPE